MLYDLSMHMGYVYDTPASGARHLVRVMPLSIPNRQRLIAGTISVSPSPSERSDFVDFFQQQATAILVRASHEKLDIRMQARVLVEAPPLTADLSTPLAQLDDDIFDHWSLDPASPHHLAGTSPRIPDTPEIAAYARSRTAPDMTVREAALALCAAIFRDFKYDPKATTVDSTPAEAFEMKRGVCQDFSHIMICALRSLGIPAGYVSGYLRTIPPPGKERLEGADAMHAWVKIWCGRNAGYLELDPTNDIPAGSDHIVAAYGRDYSDVAPVIGVLKTYGNHKTVQSVDVLPIG